MGGYGSGDWQRWIAKPLVETCRSLDVRWLNREGVLSPGTDFSHYWLDNYGKQVASIGVLVGYGNITLRYQYHRSDKDWKEVEEAIPLTWTPCNYGGKRAWFRCPGMVNGLRCGRRVAKLYQRGKYFRCRTCHSLGYATQREAVTERLRERACRIRKRLGGPPNIFTPFPPKPKGMHWKTYFRLEDRAEKAEVQYLEESLSALRASFPD